MKKLKLLSVLLLVAAFAFGQSNESYVYQEGLSNIATVKQLGDDNDAFMSLVGDGNIIWQCQTGFNNSESFDVVDGNYNGTWSFGYFWTPYNCKFYTKYLFDPSNTQHQFGCMNLATTYISLSDNNKVSQTQGYWYFGNWAHMNMANILITGYSHYNAIMQAQLGSYNWSQVGIYDYSDLNNVMTHQRGSDNVIDIFVGDGSDGNYVAATQGCNTNWAYWNQVFVDIWNDADNNQFVVNQRDGNNYAEILAHTNSDGNLGYIHQEGWFGNWAHIFFDMWSFYNEISICQWDQGNHDARFDSWEGDWTVIFDGRYTNACTPMSSYGWFYPLPYTPFGDKVYTRIGYDPTNVIHQDGYFNHAAVDVYGIWSDGNMISIFQEGFNSYNNLAYINIHESAYNAIALYQTGDHNVAEAHANWSAYNEFFTFQVGLQNYAYINANASNGNFASIVQGEFGSDLNHAEIWFDMHNDGIAVINQFGLNHTAWMSMHDGTGNQGAIYQRGYESYAWMDLSGDYNFAAVCQHYYGYHNAWVAISGENNGFNYTYDMQGAGTPFFVPSNPGYFCGQWFKVWNEIYYDPTNMVHQEGYCQWANVNITGGGYNRVSIYQVGDLDCANYGCINNYASVDVVGGWDNKTAQYQEGQRNESYIYIDGANWGKANTFQVGVENYSSITQQFGSDNWAGVLQYGNNHIGTIHQVGTWNEATVNQFNW